MSELVEWLLEQIAEDEHCAHYALTRDPVAENSVPGWGGWWLGHYQHYHRWDPARVLAECEAKRRLIRAHNKWCDGSCGDGETSSAYPYHQAHYWSIKVLAEVYADRPGYREEWRP